MESSSQVKLYNFWFPDEIDNYQEFWFDGSKDIDIKEKFEIFLTICEEEKTYLQKKLLQEYSSSNESLLRILTYIILFDQITRNISRINENSNYKRNDNIALILAKMIIENNDDYKLPFIMKMFILLPFRHTHTTPNLDFVIQRLQIYEISEKEKKIYDRFFIATLKDYSKTVDTIIKIENITETIPVYDDNIHDIECEYFPSINSNIDIILKKKIYNTICKFILENNIKRIGISLSGGVDSNVLMYILKQLTVTKILDIVVAIHVDYGNREESTHEANYLIELCKFLQIPIVTRKIEHMKREHMKRESVSLDRKFYEEESKNIRFNLYKFAIKTYNLQGICLGHHYDDLAENVFMNFMRGRELLKLFTMTPMSELDGVTIMRPMLEHPKKDIYDFAKDFGIIYFKDTTPDWSFRGVIRRKIFPEIQKFDPCMLDNLNIQGKCSDEWDSVVKNVSISPILKTIINGRCGFTINVEKNMHNLPMSFWSKLLSSMFHNNSINMISHKCLNVFIHWINNNLEHSKQCSLFKTSNKLVLYYDKNKLYSFSNKLLTINVEPYIIHYDIHNTRPTQIVYNNWIITISNVQDKEYLKNKMTLSDLVVGEFTYTEQINELNTFEVKYSSLDRKDNVRKLFSKLGKMSEYVPKITSGILGLLKNIGFVKINIKFIV